MLSVRRAVCDAEDVASPSRRVLSGLSWGMLESSVTIQDVACWDTTGETCGSRSVLRGSVLSLLLLLLLASVVAATRADVNGSVDRRTVSNDLMLVSVKVCVCSVSVEKQNNAQ